MEKYSYEFKKRVVDAYLNGEGGYIYLAETYGIAAWSNIKKWVLALETSCEGVARIAKTMNIKVSGDTIIKILLKKYDAIEPSICSSTVGIDDFAFKKRHNYGTITVDEKTHKPIEILDGRDGSTLLNWLRNNKYI